jgi:hypothetical protein
LFDHRLTRFPFARHRNRCNSHIPSSVAG